jgi:hypothetical protein
LGPTVRHGVFSGMWMSVNGSVGGACCGLLR